MIKNQKNYAALIPPTLALFFTALLLTLAGCGTYVPEGATVVKVINSKYEFDRADIIQTKNELAQTRSVHMKWYDTNTFLTTATFNKGIYSFRARNYDGAAMSRDIAMDLETDYYEIDAGIQRDTKASLEGPEVKGRLAGVQSGSVAVLFIGNQIVMKTADIEQNGAFSVNAPSKGNWKIEVHRLGDTPQSYTRQTMNITGAVDLGNIPLK